MSGFASISDSLTLNSATHEKCLQFYVESCGLISV